MKPIYSRVAFKAQLTKELGFTPVRLWKGAGHVVKTYRKPVTTPTGEEGYSVLFFDSGNGSLQILVGVGLQEPLDYWTAYSFLSEKTGNIIVSTVPGNILSLHIHDKPRQNKEDVSNINNYSRIKQALQELEESGYFTAELHKVLKRYEFGSHVKADIAKTMHKYLPQYIHVVDEHDKKGNIWFYTNPEKGKKTVQVIRFSTGEHISILIGKARIQDGGLVVSKPCCGESYFYGSYKYIHSQDKDQNGEPSMFWKPSDLPIAIKELRNHFNGTKRLKPYYTLGLVRE